MGKHIVYTVIHPLPSNVPRQLVLDLLHSHDEVIKMNPLVTEVKSIEAPTWAAADEFFSNWYRIYERTPVGLGIKKKIQFEGVFHDQAYGLQSHIYAPLNTDMRQTYKVGGNQPGEPPEEKELGVKTPASGLYLREDVNIKVATPFMGPTVEKEMRANSKVMIERILKKAELLDEGKLHAMFEKGKLKTAKPSGEPTYSDRPLPSPGRSPLGSPGGTPESMFSPSFQSPNVDSKGFGRYSDIAPDRSGSVRSSYVPPYQQKGYQGPQYAQPGAELPGGLGLQQSFVSELEGSYSQQPQQDNMRPGPLRPNAPQPMAFRAEMMGDTTFLHPQRTPPPQQQSAEMQPPQTNGGYQAYSRSPQASPRLPSQPQASPRLPSQPQRQSSGSGYQITNPDRPPSNGQNAYTSQMDQWHRNVQADTPIDGDYYRNSRNSHSGPPAPIEPDHQRLSKLSFSQNASDLSPQEARPQTSTSKCPVCGLFEGDEGAVSHHVTKEHFR